MLLHMFSQFPMDLSVMKHFHTLLDDFSHFLDFHCFCFKFHDFPNFVGRKPCFQFFLMFSVVFLFFSFFYEI